MNVQSASGSVD